MARQSPKLVSNALMILVTILALGGGFALGALFFYNRGASPTTATPPSQAQQSDRPIPGRGRIEPVNGIIHLGNGTPDRVERILVEEGDTVAAGRILVEMESKTGRELAVQMARTRLEEAKNQKVAINKQGQAELDVADAELKKLEALAPLEEEAQQMKIDLLYDQHRVAETNLGRLKGLPPQTVADQDKEQQKIVVKQSETQLQEAQLAKRQLEAKTKSEKAVLKARQAAAQSKAKQAESEISIPILEKRVAQAEEELKQSIIRAPSSGTILHIDAHKGDVVAGKSIIEMADTDKMQVSAEIHESFFWRVKVGLRATITSDVLKQSGEEGKPLKGRVSWKGSTFGQQHLFGLNPRARQDERVFEVRILLDNSKEAANLIGHQVDVTIESPSGKEHANAGRR